MKIKSLLYVLFLTLFIFLFSSCSTKEYINNNIIIQPSNYEDDIIYGFEKLTVNMGKDYEGNVTTTIIRKKTNLTNDSAFLYIHGFNDYFFQYELAEKIEEDGYRFYAIDLRKFGRSILPHQKPSNFRDIREYYPDIDLAINVMKSEGIKNIVILAHSTGGLIASLYIEDNKQDDTIKLLVLNSPFFDFNLKGLKKAIVPIISFIGKFSPDTKNKIKEKNFYLNTISKDMDGEWIFNKDWKMNKLEPTYGWIRGIHNGQKRIKKGLSLDIPVLVMRSSKSEYIYTEKAYNNYDGGDLILSVKDIAKYSIGLGNNITNIVIDKAFHDIFLSRKDIREKGYKNMFFWVNSYINYEK